MEGILQWHTKGHKQLCPGDVPWSTWAVTTRAAAIIVHTLFLLRGAALKPPAVPEQDTVPLLLLHE